MPTKKTTSKIKTPKVKVPTTVISFRVPKNVRLILEVEAKERGHKSVSAMLAYQTMFTSAMTLARWKNEDGKKLDRIETALLDMSEAALTLTQEKLEQFKQVRDSGILAGKKPIPKLSRRTGA